jgi:hypothetical protein
LKHSIRVLDTAHWSDESCFERTKPIHKSFKEKNEISCTHTIALNLNDIYIVDPLTFLFGVFGGLCGESSCNLFLLVPVSATLFRRAVLTQWHALLFLGLRVSPSFLLFAWWPPQLFLVRNCHNLLTYMNYIAHPKNLSTNVKWMTPIRIYLQT